jgi:hypothetical protein
MYGITKWLLPQVTTHGMEYPHNRGLRDIGYENIPMTRDVKLRLFVNIPFLTLSTRIFTWPGVR